MPASKDTSWRVVDNALDFLRESVHVMADDDRDDKYAVIHLYSAIEVLVKARLIREHWTLCLKSLDGATTARFAAGQLKTPGVDEGIKRLVETVGLDIAEAQVRKVTKLGELRDRAVHFALIDEHPLATRTKLAKGLSFALWFLEAHVEPDAPPAEAESIADVKKQIWVQLGSIKELVNDRLGSLTGALEAERMLLKCPHCEQAALSLPEGDAPRCLFCYWTSPGGAGADEYVEEVLGLSGYAVGKEGGTWPVHTCEECSNAALVAGATLVKGAEFIGPPPAMDVVMDEDWLSVEPWWVCFACSNVMEPNALSFCGDCGEPTSSSMFVCEDCFDARVSRD